MILELSSDLLVVISFVYFYFKRSKEEYMLLEYNRLQYIQAEDGQVLGEVL